MAKSPIQKRWQSIPVYEFLGLRVERTGKRSARMRLPWRHELTQPLGFVHGGILATLADATAGWALFPAVDHPEGCTTLEMKINYLAPVVRRDVVASAEVVKLGRTIAVMDVDVRAGKTLVAKALVTYHVKR